MLSIRVDTTEIESLLNLSSRLKDACKQASEDFAKDISGHITQEAMNKLHSRRDKYLENLYVKQLSGNTWIVGLKEPAAWIEEGQSPGNMLQNLLKGKTHRAIPMEKGSKTGSQPMTSAQNDLLSTIKEHFEKQKKIKLEDIETHDDGKPKLGKLHSFSIKSAPMKTNNGPGQGQGPVGQVRQGRTGTPFLQGVRVYQKLVEKGGKKETKRVITTFRMASISQEGSGTWDHPGNKAMNFFQEAEEWAIKKWDTEYGPRLLKNVLDSI